VNKKVLRITVAALITILLVGILISQVNIEKIAKILSGVNPAYLAIGLILYALAYLLRTTRFYVLLNKEIGLRDLFAVVCLHNLANNLLPARIGELSFVYLLKKYHNRNIGEGIANLILARLFDGIAVSLLFLVSTLFVTLPEFTVVGVISTFLLFTILFVVILLKEDTINLLKTCLRKVASRNTKSIRYILTKVEETLDAFEKARFDNLPLTFALSVCIWLTLYSVVFVLLLAMGSDLGFFDVVFASTFALLTTILPIQGIAGFGTIEGGWIVGFMLIGLTKELAISTGFVFHTLILAYSVILGFYGFSQIIMFKKQMLGYEKK